MVFEGTTGVYERIYRFNSKLMSKKEGEICEFEIDLKNFFVCALIQVMMTCKTTLRPGLKTGMDFRGLV